MTMLFLLKLIKMVLSCFKPSMPINFICFMMYVLGFSRETEPTGCVYI